MTPPLPGHFPPDAPHTRRRARARAHTHTVPRAARLLHALRSRARAVHPHLVVDALEAEEVPAPYRALPAPPVDGDAGECGVVLLPCRDALLEVTGALHWHLARLHVLPEDVGKGMQARPAAQGQLARVTGLKVAHDEPLKPFLQRTRRRIPEARRLPRDDARWQGLQLPPQHLRWGGLHRLLKMLWAANAGCWLQLHVGDVGDRLRVGDGLQHRRAAQDIARLVHPCLVHPCHRTRLLLLGLVRVRVRVSERRELGAPRRVNAAGVVLRIPTSPRAIRRIIRMPENCVSQSTHLGHERCGG